LLSHAHDEHQITGLDYLNHPLGEIVLETGDSKWIARTVNMIVKAEGPSGRAKIYSDGPKHALGLVQYPQSIGYEAWIEDAEGNEIEETVLKKAIKPPSPG
jgi:hypothetical protein